MEGSSRSCCRGTPSPARGCPPTLSRVGLSASLKIQTIAPQLLQLMEAQEAQAAAQGGISIPGATKMPAPRSPLAAAAATEAAAAKLASGEAAVSEVDEEITQVFLAMPSRKGVVLEAADGDDEEEEEEVYYLPVVRKPEPAASPLARALRRSSLAGMLGYSIDEEGDEPDGSAAQEAPLSGALSRSSIVGFFSGEQGAAPPPPSTSTIDEDDEAGWSGLTSREQVTRRRQRLARHGSLVAEMVDEAALAGLSREGEELSSLDLLNLAATHQEQTVLDRERKALETKRASRAPTRQSSKPPDVLGRGSAARGSSAKRGERPSSWKAKRPSRASGTSKMDAIAEDDSRWQDAISEVRMDQNTHVRI
jgi:hypothetical protein